MAAPDIDDAFVKQFESEAILDYQQMGSKLRNTGLRVKNGVTGSSTTFQRIGTATVGSKSREGDIPVSHPDHTPVECTLQDRYVGVYIDKLDELKIQHGERQAQSTNLSSAMGRDTDDIILTEMDNSANANNNGTATTWTTAAAVIAYMEYMGKASVPFDGNLYCVCPWEAWGDLLDIDEFSNADYVPSAELWSQGVTAKKWLGINFFPHENLNLDGSNDAKGFFYHGPSVGHAFGQDLQLDMDWIPTKRSTLAAGEMSHGAKIIDDTGVIEYIYDITP